jgi:hypothetical protein
VVVVRTGEAGKHGGGGGGVHLCAVTEGMGCFCEKLGFFIYLCTAIFDPGVDIVMQFDVKFVVVVFLCGRLN